MYGLEVILGIGAGSYVQGAFAVIQAILEPAEAFNGLTMMLLGMTLSILLHISCAKISQPKSAEWLLDCPWVGLCSLIRHKTASTKLSLRFLKPVSNSSSLVPVPLFSQP